VFRTLMLSLFALLTVGPAHAQAVSLLATSPLVGDGVTPATLRVWVEGTTVTDRVKVNPTEGKAGDPVLSADGVVAFSYVPPAVTAAKQVGIEVSVRGAVKLDRRIEVPVNPPPAGTYSVTFDPPQVVLGRDAAATIRIKGSGTSPVAPEARSVLLNASFGTISEPTPGGDGTFVARWTPPATLEGARTLLVGVTDRAAPGSISGWGALPVIVDRSVTFDVLAGSQNVLVVGDRTYGPVQATPQGKVSFPLQVDPRQLTAKLQTVRGTERTEKTVDVPIADYPRALVLPMAPRVPGSSDVTHDVWVVAIQKTGAPLDAASVVAITASTGTITPAIASVERKGAWSAKWTAPAGGTGSATITAAVAGQESKASLELVPPIAALQLSAEPAELLKGQRDIVITARAKDARGSALAGHPPILVVSGGTLQGALVDNQDGSYTAKVKLDTGSSSATVTAESPVTPSALLPYRILAWPKTGVIPADGKAKTDVVIVVVDRYGLPVPNVPVTLSVPASDGNLPPRAVTNERGIAHATFTAGTRSGAGVIRVEGSGVWGAAPIFQRGAVAPSSTSIPSGTPMDVALTSAWSASMASTTVNVQGSGPKAGPPAAATVTTVPQFTTPGAAIQAIVRVVDANQLPVKAQRVVVTSTVGTVSKVTDGGDGSYTATVQLPAGRDGPVTIAASVGTTVKASVSLPTFASMGSLGPAAAAILTQPAPPPAAPAPAGTEAPPAEVVQPPPVEVDEAKTKAPKTKSAAAETEQPWLTAGLAFALMPHSYSMTSEGGEDVPPDASFTNGPLNGGFDVRVVAWPKNESIGLEGRYKGFVDALQVANEDTKSFGTNFHLGARYRRELGASASAWYVAAGFAGISPVVFRYESTELDTVELIRVPLYGGRVGAGMLVDEGPFAIDVNITEMFAPAPVDTALSGTVDYKIADAIALRGGLDFDLIATDIDVGDETAKVTDIQYGINIGVAYLMF
jgi:hypothetical protein